MLNDIAAKAPVVPFNIVPYKKEFEEKTPKEMVLNHNIRWIDLS